MLRGPVAAVSLEAVPGVLRGETTHRAVAQHLGHHAGCGDRRTPAIRPRQGLYSRTEREVAICESATSVRCHQREGARERLPVCPADAEPVYPPGRESYQGDGFGAEQHLPEEPLAEVRFQNFGVVELADLGFKIGRASCRERV